MTRSDLSVPSIRVRVVSDVPPNPDGEWVLYWMTAQRRTSWSHALDHAVDLARRHARPLLVLEALRCDYPWASDRLHRFVVEGMRDNRDRLQGTPIGYLPFVEDVAGAGRGLLAALASRSVVVVTDDSPTFFLPDMLRAAAASIEARIEAVDGSGLLPLAATDRAFSRAFDFRRHLQRRLPAHLGETPRADPLDAADLPATPPLPPAVLSRWPAADLDRLCSDGGLAHLPIDHAVGPVPYRGGSAAASALLERFIAERLPRYVEGRLDLDDRATSELSPYLHFGHVGAHEVFAAVIAVERWSVEALSPSATGGREGWWGMSPAAEAFLDQLVTWRELGSVFQHHERPNTGFDSLPAWALETLARHAVDPRPFRYSLRQLERAATHDEIWNAAQRELLRDGRIHNYLRMLWGKKILEWSADPRTALEVMTHLNNKYAVDGRDPSSDSGLQWCLGRFDRAWGPERAIFGKVRYMSSDSARRKLRLGDYLVDLGPQQNLF